MKHLVIIRHSKSSWANALLDDFDRPLNARGKKDAPMMAQRLGEKKMNPDLLITSPAKRAYSTSKKFAEFFDVEKNKIIKEPKLYHASEKMLLKISHDLDDTYNVVFLFGHNPGLTNFVNDSSNLEIDNIPTTGVVMLEISSWKKFGKERAKAIYFDYPGNL